VLAEQVGAFHLSRDQDQPATDNIGCVFLLRVRSSPNEPGGISAGALSAGELLTENVAILSFIVVQLKDRNRVLGVYVGEWPTIHSLADHIALYEAG
jgi:hypothetical protein